MANLKNRRASKNVEDRRGQREFTAKEIQQAENMAMLRLAWDDFKRDMGLGPREEQLPAATQMLERMEQMNQSSREKLGRMFTGDNAAAGVEDSIRFIVEEMTGIPAFSQGNEMFLQSQRQRDQRETQRHKQKAKTQ